MSNFLKKLPVLFFKLNKFKSFGFDESNPYAKTDNMLRLPHFVRNDILKGGFDESNPYRN